MYDIKLFIVKHNILQEDTVKISSTKELNDLLFDEMKKLDKLPVSSKQINKCNNLIL